MRAVEFECTVSATGGIALPAEVASEIPAGENLRVVVMWEPPAESSLDEVWRNAGRRRFEAAWCAEDSIYDELIDAPALR